MSMHIKLNLQLQVLRKRIAEVKHGVLNIELPKKVEAPVEKTKKHIQIQ